MKASIVDLSDRQVEALEHALEEYDREYIKQKISGNVSIGILEGDTLIAGLDACMTAFRILYVSTVYVDEKHRRKGYGRLLIEEMEKRAKTLGANTIRLDTFSFQGREFYLAMGYEQAGAYRNAEDGYEEYFFVKRI